ncbi:hypothetical protein [Oligoflexus tunisiensis]|uniref:hypothetical protein n=1 Tax=Oligoflexus tunisiensis TaxID=708132 RepID=UPI00114D0360|nr:hypothetical protein [Oligoflexus tunisiensis]
MDTPHSRRVFLTYSAQTLVAVPTLVSSPWLLAADAPDFVQDVTFKHLRPSDHKVLVVLLPAALGVDLDPDHPEDQKLLRLTLKGLDHVIDCLSERSRQDLMLLLDLLSMPLTRALLGLWTRWDKAPRAEVEEFLNQWERSSISLKRFGYQSLVQILEFAFYGVRANTVALRYPDVPAAIQPFLRRFSAGVRE